MLSRVLTWGAAVVFVVFGLAFTGLAQTLRVDSNRVPVGSLTRVPVVLNAAPQGLSGFTVQLSISNHDAATFEGVVFPGDWVREGSWEIVGRGDLLEIASKDVNNAFNASDTEILLAEVLLRGTARASTQIQIVSNQLLDDGLTQFQVAISNATLEVTGGPDPGLTGLVGGNDGVSVDALSATPVILTGAPRGLKSYRISLRLEQGTFADIEGVDFEAFGGNAEFDISSDRDSVSFSAHDLDHVVSAGDEGIVLARVRIRGQLLGNTPLMVTANRLEDDAGGSVSPTVEHGILTVGARLDVPPEFTGLQPQAFSVLSNTQPAITVDIGDVGSGLDPNTVQVVIVDSSRRQHSFDLQSHGASWDGHTFRVNLAQAGVSLAAGRVDVEIHARDQGGHFGFAAWQFVVEGGGGGPGGQTIAQALDANDNGRLDDAEIVVAITLWITGTPVPGVGQLISDDEIKRLIQLWVTGASV